MQEAARGAVEAAHLATCFVATAPQLTDGVGLLDLVADSHADVHAGVLRGERPRERGAPYGSDLRLYEAAGIPTLHYGLGDVRLTDGPRESVAIRELETVIGGALLH